MQGYDENAAQLIPRYEALDFDLVHKPVRHLFPEEASAILDIGAGTGRDASILANRGHKVVAVEPTAAFRQAGAKLHPSANIEWVNDHLPGLERLDGYHGYFDLVMMSGVWMHLDGPEQISAMTKVCALMKGTSKLILSLRHGPIPPERRMFDVSADTTIDLAEKNGLKTILRENEQSLQEENRRAGVKWTHLAFLKPNTPNQ